MKYLRTLLLTGVLVLAGGLVAQAQTNQPAAENISGQTGQSENFRIQRDTGGFIGGSTEFLGGQTAAGAGGAGTAGLLGALGSITGRGNTGLGSQAATQATQQNAAQPQIRFRITLGFSHPLPAGTKVSATLARRLSRIPQLAAANSVAVTMEDRTAVLAGQVESEREKRLIEKLAMMEPGVSAVRNELTVKAALELLPQPAGTN